MQQEENQNIIFLDLDSLYHLFRSELVTMAAMNLKPIIQLTKINLSAITNYYLIINHFQFYL